MARATPVRSLASHATEAGTHAGVVSWLHAQLASDRPITMSPTLARWIVTYLEAHPPKKGGSPHAA